jgi:hypothetical protein
MTVRASSKPAKLKAQREGVTNSQRYKSHEFPRIFLLKSERFAICSPRRNLFSHSLKDGREDGKPWPFETLAHNLPRESKREAIFLLTSPATR